MLNTTWNALAKFIKIQRGKNTLLLNSDTVGELLNSKGLVDELTKYAEQKKEKRPGFFKRLFCFLLGRS